MDAILKAQPAQLPRAQQLFRQTQEVLNKFELLYFDDQSLAVVAQLTARFTPARNRAALRKSYKFSRNSLRFSRSQPATLECVDSE